MHFKKDSLTLGQSLFPKVKRLLKHFKNLLLNTDTSEGRLSTVVNFYLVLQAKKNGLCCKNAIAVNFAAFIRRQFSM